MQHLSIYKIIKLSFFFLILMSFAQSSYGTQEKISPKSTFKSSDEQVNIGASDIYINKNLEVKYTYNTSGVAVFSNAPELGHEKLSSANSWYIKCEKDSMSDEIKCLMMRKSIGIVYKKGKLPRVMVGFNNYPESEIFIRIDKLTPHQANYLGFMEDESQKIISEMQTGGEIVTRHSDWPYKAGIDTKISTFGFKQAYEFMVWFADQIK